MYLDNLDNPDHIRVYVYPRDKRRVLNEASRENLFAWCAENCKGPFWIGMGFGQFIEEEDASLFALTWAFR